MQHLGRGLDGDRRCTGAGAVADVVKTHVVDGREDVKFGFTASPSWFNTSSSSFLLTSQLWYTAATMVLVVAPAVLAWAKATRCQIDLKVNPSQSAPGTAHTRIRTQCGGSECWDRAHQRSRCRCGGFLGRTHYAISVRDLLCVGVQPAPGWRESASRGVPIKTKEFRLELEPGVLVSVLSQDVTLFDVIGGRLAVEHQLSEAPDALRSFMLGNIMPGVGANGHSINYLGLGLEERLQFCESALVVGSLDQDVLHTR